MQEDVSPLQMGDRPTEGGQEASGPGVGKITWWSLVKEQQGACHSEALLPLTRPGGSTAMSSRNKATPLAELFANKMKMTIRHDLHYSWPKKLTALSPPSW